MQSEVGPKLAHQGFEAVGVQLLERAAFKTMRPVEWFNNDVNFQMAVGEVLEAKNDVLEPKRLFKLIEELLPHDECIELCVLPLSRVVSAMGKSAGERDGAARVLQWLKDKGVTASRMHQAGATTPVALKAAGFGASQLWL